MSTLSFDQFKAFFRPRRTNLMDNVQRPISSTTTATHSTITPLPSDAFRNNYSDLCTLDDDSRPETPSSTRRNLLFHSFFGIALSRRSSSSATSHRKNSFSTSTSTPKSSRKRSFRLTSRPSTPKDDSFSSRSPYPIPVPSNPLPLSASPRRRSFGLGTPQRSTPKSSTTNLPLQLPHSGRSHGRRHSVGSERPPHDSAVALSEVPSLRSVHKAAHPFSDTAHRNKGKQREKLFPDSVSDSRLSPSQSLPIDPAPISRHYLSHLPIVDSASSEEHDQSSLAPLRFPVIPRIIHTPPTPQRPGELTPPVVNTTHVKAVIIPHREQLLVSSSRSHVNGHTPPSKGRFTPRLFGGKDSRVKDNSGQKSTKRPTPATCDASVQKTPSSSPARNMTSHRSKLGSFDFERPVSALNQSSSTVDRQASKDNPPCSKSRFHAMDRTISQDSTRGGKSTLIAHHPAESSLIKPVHTGDTSVVSFSSVSLQTMSTGKGTGSNTPAGQSSSWGRASARRILHTSHGIVAFEHPAVPNSPTPQNINLPNRANQNGEYIPTTTLHTIFDAPGKHSRGQSYNASDRAESGHSKPSGRKPKGKGRSLDLGLGLSWAPSRLREEVLMPGMILSREKAKSEKSNGYGSDVTRVFESVLSEARFQTFKEYVHRFDAHIIPLGGPSGLLARVEKLLADAGLGERERTKLVSDFAIFVENHAV